MKKRFACSSLGFGNGPRAQGGKRMANRQNIKAGIDVAGVCKMYTKTAAEMQAQTIIKQKC